MGGQDDPDEEGVEFNCTDVSTQHLDVYRLICEDADIVEERGGWVSMVWLGVVIVAGVVVAAFIIVLCWRRYRGKF